MNPDALLAILQGPGSGGNLPFPTPGAIPPPAPSNGALASAMMPMNNEIPPLPAKKKKLSAVAQLVAAHFARQSTKTRLQSQQPMGNTNGANY